MKKSWVIPLIVVIVIICLCAIIAETVYYFKVIEPGQATRMLLFPKRTSAPEITVFSPDFGGGWRVNDNIPLQAETTGTSRIVAFEVWVDGHLFGAQDDLQRNDLKTVSGTWLWQPGTVGPHSVLFRAVDVQGLTTYSELIQIHAVEAVDAVQAVSPKKGQTLADVAASNQVDLEKVEKLNPRIDPAKLLSPDFHILIPHEPIPVKPIDLSTLHEYEIPADTKGGLPAAPTLIKAENQGACDAYLEFKDNASNEDGFRIYRANPSMNNFAKVADLPPSITKPVTFTDKGLNIKGKWTYYAAAFNGNGEAKSVPATLEITDPSCYPKEPEAPAGENTAPVLLDLSEIGIITVNEKVEQAYIYLTINDQTRRIPEGEATFFQGSGYKFDLSKYLLAAAETLPPTTKSYHINVELWGWKNNKPYLVDSYTKDITDFTILLGCMVTPADACEKDNSRWTQNIVIPADVKPDSAQFRFKLLAFKPFDQYTVSMMGLKTQNNPSWYEMFALYTTQLGKPGQPAFQPYYFTDSLAPYLNATAQDPGFQFQNCLGDKECKSTFFGFGFENGGWFKMYYEIQPWLYGQNPPAPELSNRVYIMQKAPPELPVEQTTPLTPPLPDLYQVEFLDATYTPAKLADPALWGCIRYLEAADGFAKDDIVCPPPIPNDPCSESTWNLDCVGQMLTEEGKIIVDAYEYVAGMYAKAFETLIKGIVDVIPGCDSSDACKFIVNKAVEAAWTYMTGLPTSLPDSEAVQSAGLDYAVGYAVDQTVADLVKQSGIKDKLPGETAEYFDSKLEDLKKLLKDEIMSQLLASKRGSSGNVTMTCQNPDIAKSRGRLPVCPSGAWEPAPGSQITPPTIKVKITRKPLTQNNNYGTDASTATPQENSGYALRITSHTINTYRVGTIIPVYGGYVENYPTESSPCTNVIEGEEAKYCYYDSVPVPGWWRVEYPLEAAPYRDIEVPIPWMQPGESIQYSIELKPKQYYAGKHETYIHNAHGDINKWAFAQGDDWGYLYFFGETKLHAEEVCQSNMPDKIYCGSSDDFAPPVPTNP